MKDSVKLELQGTYKEFKRTEVIDNKFQEFEYKFLLKENTFELTQTKANTCTERKREESGGSMNMPIMSFLQERVEITITFKIKEFKSNPLPEYSHKSDFVMKYSKITNEIGSFNLSFVSSED